MIVSNEIVGIEFGLIIENFLRCRALYVQELLLGTVDENSQNVITNTPAEVSITSIVDEQSAAVAQMNLEDDMEDHAAAQALQHQQQHHHAGGGPEAAMKKSFMRKKEMTAVDDGGKKQKSKVSNTRK